MGCGENDFHDLRVTLKGRKMRGSDGCPYSAAKGACGTAGTLESWLASFFLKHDFFLYPPLLWTPWSEAMMTKVKDNINSLILFYTLALKVHDFFSLFGLQALTSSIYAPHTC